MQVSLLRTVLRRSLVEIGIFSIVLNLLVLVQPVYMLQVYDRVLASANTNTLYFLTLIAVAALALMGIIEIVRQNYANRMAARLEPLLGPQALMVASNSTNAAVGDTQPLRDLTTSTHVVPSNPCGHSCHPSCCSLFMTFPSHPFFF